MNRTRKDLVSVYLLIGALVISASLKTVAFFLEIDMATGLFPGGVFIKIADWTAAAASVLLAATIFGKKKTPATVFGNADFYIPGGAVSVALVFLAAELVLTAREAFKALNAYPTPLRGHTTELTLAIFTLAVALSALACVFSFFYGVFYVKKESSVRASFGIVATVFMAAYAAYLYFDRSLPINAPAKIADQMAFLLTALYFDMETRVSLGRPMWRAYTAFGLVSAYLMGYSSLPVLIYYFATGNMASESIAGATLAFTLFIYLLLRVIHVLRAPKDEKCETARFIEVLSEVRSIDIEAARAAREKYEAIINNIVENPDDGEDSDADEAIPEDGIGSNYVMDIYAEGGEHIEDVAPEKNDREV